MKLLKDMINPAARAPGLLSVAYLALIPILASSSLAHFASEASLGGILMITSCDPSYCARGMGRKDADV